MNVDEHEVKKFDQMALDWWDLNGPCKPLHDLNPLRLSFVQSNCVLADKSVLDVGCGGGILTEALSRFSQQAVGIDQSELALKVAREHAKPHANPPSYEFATAESYAQQYPARFDAITCMEMLEHVPSPTSVLQALADLLKPGGDLFVSTLNRTPKAFLFGIIGAEYILRLLPRGTHEYHRFIRPSELVNWAGQYGLQVKQMRGISYQPFSKTFSLTDDVSVNYLMHLKKDLA